MKSRPKSVTVVCWILIMSCIVNGISSILMHNNPRALELMNQSPLPVSVQYAILYLGLAIMLISGITMLKGKNWARMLYVGWSSIGFIVGILISPARAVMIPGIVVFAIFVFFLFRPKANAFFTGAAEPMNQENVS